MPNVLFVAAHRPDRSPSQRFRFEQYLPYLREHGYACDFSYLISAKDDRIFYRPGNTLTKGLIFFRSYLKRWRDLLRSGRYDIVFVQREAFMTGSVFFEKRFGRGKAKLIFDFDDAIWNLDVSEGNRSFHWLKNPGKTARIIALADQVIAGNQYLADYARHHNANVEIIPTTIDTDEYVPVPKKKDHVIVIGWSGSITTIKHFISACPVLERLKAKYGDKISFKVIGDATFRNPALGITGIGWNKEDELRELSSFDIGIMPLPDDEWSRGKCGLKGLQYMALEIPTVMSPVGVNAEIIQDGVNGFLAATEAEWMEKISRLVDSTEFHDEMGRAARQTVIDRYSVHSQKEHYLRLFNRVLQH
jgi:glycosyltransferase involved in cell wall biosynthesis